MQINTTKYENFYEDLKRYYPYMVDKIVEVRPWGGHGIQLLLHDGSKYNYDPRIHSMRKYEEYDPKQIEKMNDESCRNIFAINLIELMDAKGFNQRTLSERTGLSTGIIHKYINEKASPSLTALHKLAYVLDCTIGDLTSY